MCGIFALSSHSSIENLTKKLQFVSSSLSHRGPDHQAFFANSDRTIGLVHTRLSIQDLSSHGNQPMFNEQKTVSIVFNGEIYNVDLLRSELSAAGFSFVGNSDTEVLLNLYLFYGTDFLEKLNGIFAFSIWDSRNNLLWVCRDALGVKPLYYSVFADKFVCSSELKALYSFGLDFSDLDPVAIDRYLSFIYCPGDKTPSSNIFKLAPGSSLFVRDGELISTQQWYSLSSIISRERCSTRDSSFSTSSLVSKTSSLLRQAVHRQMISDVPVGAFLSGGVDSSSIVAFARELNPSIQCFTIKLDNTGSDGFVDDLPYAIDVANYLNVPLSVVQVDANQMAQNLESMVWQLDEPLADPACLNLLFISRLARDSGIKVLLSGAGGDDLFSGYRRHMALESEKWWRFLPRPVRLQLRAFTAHFPSSYPLTRRLRKAFSGAHLEGDARLVHYFRWIERSDLLPLYTSAFREALANSNAEDPMIKFLGSLSKDTPLMDRMLALEQRFFLPDHNLNYTDKMSMAVGVEVRVPFLDIDLVRHAGEIPSSYKQRGGEGKWILKKAMQPHLPHNVIYRPKTGFGLPLRRWLRVELRDWLEAILSPERLVRRGIFNPHAVQSLIQANVAGKVDASYTLFSLACIEVWSNKFIDSNSSL